MGEYAADADVAAFGRWLKQRHPSAWDHLSDERLGFFYKKRKPELWMEWKFESAAVPIDGFLKGLPISVLADVFMSGAKADPFAALWALPAVEGSPLAPRSPDFTRLGEG